ncbi:MAG: hypothetical protein C0514_07195 [Candidatus Puniceispirillum sp.]|nr:hypothetical protein [Candidatus Puniceispirillum sp.]
MSHIEAKKQDAPSCTPMERRAFEHPEVFTEEALFFHHGIIGFGNDQRYTLTPFPRAEYVPLQLLIHHQNPSIHFLIVCDQELDQKYHVNDLSYVYQTFGYNAATTKCYFIVTVMGQGAQMLVAINQRAPVLIDHAGKRAGQHIMADTQLPLSVPLPEFSVALRARITL